MNCQLKILEEKNYIKIEKSVKSISFYDNKYISGPIKNSINIPYIKITATDKTKNNTQFFKKLREFLSHEFFNEGIAYYKKEEYHKFLKELSEDEERFFIRSTPTAFLQKIKEDEKFTVIEWLGCYEIINNNIVNKRKKEEEQKKEKAIEFLESIF